MSWFKLDDQFPDHPKLVTVGGDAGWLYVCAGCYASRHLTDGFVPTQAVERLSDRRNVGKLVALLCGSGLWEMVEGGYQIHHYLEYNPSREQVLREREWAKQRGALNRDPELTRAIRERDQDRCRYCGQKVNFKDRRSEGGGTYDHVIPRGPNTMENVVVACRSCNMRKAARTPAEAGLVLLDPGQFRSSSKPDKNQTPDPTRPEVLTEPLGDAAVAAPDPRVGELIAGYVDDYRIVSNGRDPDREWRGAAGKAIQRALRNGEEPEDVARCLGVCASEGKNPSTLANVLADYHAGRERRARK